MYRANPNISFKLDISVAEFWQLAGTAQRLRDRVFCFMCGLLSDRASRPEYIL